MVCRPRSTPIGIGVQPAVEHVFAQAVAADHLAAVVDEAAQQAEFLRAQRQGLTVQLEAPGVHVQLQRAALQARAGVAVAAADQRPQAQDQFVGLEGFGQVVVGTSVETGQLVVPAPARGQYQHRERAAVAAPAFDHAQTVQAGQAQIDDGGLQILHLPDLFGLAAIGHHLHHVAGLFQQRLQAVCQGLIVLGQQDAHQSSSSVFSSLPVRAS